MHIDMLRSCSVLYLTVLFATCAFDALVQPRNDNSRVPKSHTVHRLKLHSSSRLPPCFFHCPTGALDFWYSHAMISAESQKAISENCDFNNIGPLLRGAEALTLPGTHSSKAAPPPPTAAELGSRLDKFWRGLTAGLSGRAKTESGSSSSSSSGVSVGHTDVHGWGESGGSSSTTRFWESLGLKTASDKLRDKDLICARW